FFNYALMIRQDYDITSSLRRGALHLYIDAEGDKLGDLGEPDNYKAALLDLKYDKWLNAMNVEMQFMKDNEVWVLVKLPPNGKIVGSKWLFTKKTNMDGVVHTYKALLMAKGYTQIPWIDYEETFYHVADIGAIRILIAIAAYYDYEIWQMDVKTAFLNGYLNEEVYMEQHEGFVNPKYPNRQYCMKNSKRGSIPMQEKLKLSKSQGASSPAELKRMQNVPYASTVGSVMYAGRCTRLDVAFAQNVTSQFQQNPCNLHWTTVKNILKYLRNTKDMFLVYEGDVKRELRVSCYIDAGYLTDADDLKSQTGYVFILNGGAEAVWVRKFISRLGVVLTIEEPISMYSDNTRAIAIANESGITKGARHFRAKVYYLCEAIEYGDSPEMVKRALPTSVFTSNSVESVNACTIVYRKLPVLKLAETYRAMVQDWYYKRRKLAASHDRPTFNTNNSPPKRSYASVTHAESFNNLSQQSKLDNIKSIQLNDDDLILVDDSSIVVLIKVKEIKTISNMYHVCQAEGFVDVKIHYTFIKVPSPSFVVDERVIWIEVSGLPLCAWGSSAFKKIANLFGKFNFFDDDVEDSMCMGRACITIKIQLLISEKDNVTIKDLNFNVHVKETGTWSTLISNDMDSNESDDDHDIEEHRSTNEDVDPNATLDDFIQQNIVKESALKDSKEGDQANVSTHVVGYNETLFFRKVKEEYFVTKEDKPFKEDVSDTSKPPGFENFIKENSECSISSNASRSGKRKNYVEDFYIINVYGP
nr:RNA-directed DNA polymerase, eukaryota, reverse transcriptase zinc-binding domain protein [Tanacetum cinerariifolium]